MATRATHVVRCRNKNDPQQYIDIEVLDALALLAPSGDEILFYITQIGNAPGVNITPAIIDATGDGNQKGDKNSCSRLSHMERFTSQSDPTQFVDLEILDGFAFQPQNTDQEGNNTDQDPDNSDRGGLIDSGDTNSAQHAFVTQSTLSVEMIVDNVGLDLQKPQTEKTTRACHVNLVTDSGDSDDMTLDPDDTIPPTRHAFVGTIKTDAINFTLPNGNDVCLIVPPSTVDDVDSTQYVTDPFTGEEHSPPDNKDPNLYAFFPPDTGGSNLGTTPMSTQTGKVGPINQGLFWWIKKISPGFRPWFWYQTVQTLEAISFFGNPPPDEEGAWGYRGFQLLPFFPVIWILSVNSPLSPMGSQGSPSLELSAEEGDWDTTGAIPSAPLGPSSDPTFAAFGVLPMFDPPLPESQFSDGVPNIWQMTGVPQPNLANPSLPWNRETNPFLAPATDVAELAATKFGRNWSSVADAVNLLCEDITADPTALQWTGNPPGWEWSFNWTDPFQFENALAFGNGISPGLNHAGIPLEVHAPATVWTLAVDQLDPAVWDTRGSLIVPFPQPPVKWPVTPP